LETLTQPATPATLVKITGKFLGYRFRNESSGWCVMNVSVSEIKTADIVAPYIPKKRENIAVVGIIPNMSFSKDTEIEISGHWERYKDKEWQLNIHTVIPMDPVDEIGIEKSLSSGVIKGIGPITAKKLVRVFGKDTLKVLDDDPRRILEVPGIGEKIAKKIIESWNDQRKVSRLLMTVCSIGLSVTYARKALQMFGENAAEKIKENPYLIVHLRGIGFLKADHLAMNLGIEADHPHRIAAALLYCLREATYTEGHCFMPTNELIKKALKLLDPDQKGFVSTEKAENILFGRDIGTQEILFGITEEDRIEDETVTVLNGAVVLSGDKVYIREIYRAEQRAADAIKNLLAGEKHPKIKLEIAEQILNTKCSFLTEEQRVAVLNSLKSRISIITGLPGVGKTTTVKAIIDVLDALGVTYSLAAPTGKAAKRITEQTNRYAGTIHRLLEYNRGDKFTRNRSNPLDTDFVIVDESSMIDIQLVDSLLDAVQGYACIIFIGDFNQLPSVGPGNVLRDMIKHNLCPISQLTKIHRQAEGSSIIKVAHAIHHGKKVEFKSAGDFAFIVEEDQEKVKDILVGLVSNNVMFSPEDIQVLAPMRKGTIGVNELNASIQRSLTLYRQKIVQKLGFSAATFSALSENLFPGCKFEPGDRVIQTANDYDKNVFNGEVGYVVGIDIEAKEATVLFDGRVVTYDEDDIDQLQLAYAMTIHRSQGSEFPAVIVPVHTAHYIMLFRNLLYTAVTRAKQMLILVGSEKALDMCIRNNRPIKRYTSLHSLVLQQTLCG
jgi:exodeoxyribonuclease V alpha subunit